MAEQALHNPDGIIKDVLYPIVSEETLKDLVREFKHTGPAYKQRVYTLIRSLYSSHYRRMVPCNLDMLEFSSNNVFYGKGGEISTNRLEDQEVAVLSLHLLQNCLVYINTLMNQSVLSEKQWMDMLTPEDLRALSPLIYSHVNPYGIFKLDMMERIPIEERQSEIEKPLHF